jgi:Tfp pilus assembly protein PilF
MFYLQSLGQIDAARALLEQLIAAQPEYPRGHWHLAVLLWQTGGDLKLALVEAKRALSLDPLIYKGTQFLEILSGDLSK